jgi:hypothetical protein
VLYLKLADFLQINTVGPVAWKFRFSSPAAD